MKLVDVHCHLDHSRFDEDRIQVVKRFVEAGGDMMVTSGVNRRGNREALKFAQEFDCVQASFGIYPTDALASEVEKGEASGFRDLEELDVDEELAWIEEHAGDCVCIGEIGMDYNYEEFVGEEMKKRQAEIFRKCLRTAKKIGKTVVIHSRKAETEVIEIMEEEEMDKVIMHCFSGKKALIRRCVENGWTFSVPAVIERLNHFQMLVDMVPMSQLVTETDAPYLSPVVGGRNESANVAVTIGWIAKIKGLSEDEVADRIWENVCGLFG